MGNQQGIHKQTDKPEEKTARTPPRPAYVQITIVILGFTLLTFLGSSFMGNIVNRHMNRSIEAAFNDTEINITADLNELETLLHYISETVRIMIVEGRPFDTVSNYMNNITAHIMTADERLKEYATGVYGVFDTFNGAFHDGTGWQPPENYAPHDRPWYKAAVMADGKVGVTEPYMAMAWGTYTLTFSRQIFHEDGTPIGVICLDILLDRVRDYAVNTYYTQGSYGLLLNRQIEVLAHPDQAMWGRPLHDIDPSYRTVAADLEQGEPIMERRVINYQGEPSIVSFRQLPNGWYIGMVIHEKTYFKEMRVMRLTLIIIGIALAALFSAVILRLSQVKKELQDVKEESGLTEREREIFILLLKDISPKEIAHTLNVSYHTVVFHRTNIYRKLGIQSRAELFAHYLPPTGEKTH